MSKIPSVYLKGTLAFLLLGSGFAMGSDAIEENVVAERPDRIEAAPAPPMERPETPSSLTPKNRKAEKTVMLAQRSARPKVNAPATEAIDVFAVAAQNEDSVKTAPPAVDSGSALWVAQAPAAPAMAADTPDSFIYSELERLSAEVRQLKKDTKKPDTKKAWGSPKISGRLFVDTFGIDQDGKSLREFGDLKNKGGIREMQIAVTGNGFDSFDYKMEFSLSPSSGKVNLVDNWLGVKNLPLLGYVRVGHYKPETGLAYPSSALHTTLTEFVGPSSSFGLGRRVGISSENLFCKDRMRFFWGVFQEGATNESRNIPEDNQGQVFNMRLSAAPVYENEGRHVFHIGGHYSYVSPKDGVSVMEAKVGSIGWLATSLSTGKFDNNHNHRGGVEVAYQAGPFSVQSEYYFTKFASWGKEKERTAHGAYVELKYFLTGDHRSYNLKSGMFGAAKVKNNFHPFKRGDYNLIEGFGAWQAVLQWSYLDLSDWRGVSAKAGKQNDITLGLNWFWNPNIRWIFEYVHSEQNIGSSKRSNYSEDIFGTSIRVHF